MTTSTITVSSAQQTRQVGKALAEFLRPGDVIMLSGELGAGKTTFTQGIGTGLNVRGAVSSPTYIITRIHPPVDGNLALVHVDAYRLTDTDDLETLDLDSLVDNAVTVIEWGEGKTEGLSPDRLEIRIERATEGDIDINPDGSVNLENMDDGRRSIIFQPQSARWDDVDFTSLLDKG